MDGVLYMRQNLKVVYRDPTCTIMTCDTHLHDVVEIHVDVPESINFTRDTYFHWLDLWDKLQTSLFNDGYTVVMSAMMDESMTDRTLKFWGMFDMNIEHSSDGYYFCYKRLGD